VLGQALDGQAPVRGLLLLLLLLVLVERLGGSSVWVSRVEVRMRVRARMGGCEVWVI